MHIVCSYCAVRVRLVERKTKKWITFTKCFIRRTKLFAHLCWGIVYIRQEITEYYTILFFLCKNVKTFHTRII